MLVKRGSFQFFQSRIWHLKIGAPKWVVFSWHPEHPSQGSPSLDCYWVGSLDFNLVEIKLGFPLNPQKVVHFLPDQRPPSHQVRLGSICQVCWTPGTSWRPSSRRPKRRVRTSQLESFARERDRPSHLRTSSPKTERAPNLFLFFKQKNKFHISLHADSLLAMLTKAIQTLEASCTRG